jgi:hypothetical protein
MLTRTWSPMTMAVFSSRAPETIQRGALVSSTIHSGSRNEGTA